MTRIIHNGKIYLKREIFCGAVVIKDGRVAATGSSRELLDGAPSGTEKIDAEGALILPAFNDSHLHLAGTGRRARSADLSRARSIEEVISLGKKHIAEHAIPPGTYVEGAGVNPDLFILGEKRDPQRKDLDMISDEHPVIFSRHCGHTIYCNSFALNLAGLGESAPPVPGGTIEKDESGRPTGILKENANALARKPMPKISHDDRKAFLRAAVKTAHSFGICACGSNDTGGPDFEEIAWTYREVYDECRESGVPGLRVSMQCGVSSKEEFLDEHLSCGVSFGSPLWEDPEWGTFLKLGPVKLFADGTLGGQTAWMSRPYNDKQESRGFPVMDETLLNLFVKKAAAKSAQVVIHAIGDAGIDAAVSAIEKVTGAGKNPLRHGVIHCQITYPGLLERMAANKILAFVQPVFLADDIQILESRVGCELASTSYAWGTMRKLGIPVSYGTDGPVSSLNPMRGIEWAVLRRGGKKQSPSAFCPNECVDVYDAVDAYTKGAAFSAFDEKSLGRIAPGFWADLVFIDTDIFTVSPEEIHKAKVIRTICAGETVYKAY